MPCYFPLRGFRDPFPGPNGKYRISNIKARSKQAPAPAGVVAVDLPCGRCIGCRLERSRKWAIRCVQESQLHRDNCFLTLTYDDANLPPGGTLLKRDWQLFMKRFRKAHGEQKVKFFACGEYGETLGRPHYHACIFGFDFADKVLWKVKDGVPLFVSPSLATLWPAGFSTLGAVTFESAAYVARYVMKKVTGSKAREHYTRLDPCTGELHELQPEFVLMSRGGRSGRGLAFDWYQRFGSEVFPSDSVVVRGVLAKPPRYYDKLYELENPVGFHLVRLRRQAEQDQAADNNTLSRLKVREEVARSKLSLLKRSLDNED